MCKEIQVNYNSQGAFWQETSNLHTTQHTPTLQSKHRQNYWQDLVILPVPVGSPGASGVVGIARVCGLRVHGDAVLPRQLPGLGGGNTEAAQLDRGQKLVGLEAISWLAHRADRGGELSAVRLESDPGGARWGNINLEGRQTGNLNSKCEERGGANESVTV